MILLTLLLFHTASWLQTEALLPTWNVTYQMNLSTIVQPCNTSGFFSNDILVNNVSKFGLVDIDWSNAKVYWANAKPMNCQESLLYQAQAIKSANPQTKLFVYRNLVKALPWFIDVRNKLIDPNYSSWFLPFKLNGPYNVAPCTNTSVSTKCSNLYHDQLQTPQIPALCTVGNDCDCGTKLGINNNNNDDSDVGSGLPCGEYLYDHRNESLREWLVDTFILNSYNNTGLNGNSIIDGFFIDDDWSNTQGSIASWMPSTGFCNTYNTFGGATEEDYKCAQDMGLNASDVNDITVAWKNTMNMTHHSLVKNGGFDWQLLTGVKSPNKTLCTSWLEGNGAKGLKDKAIQYSFTVDGNIQWTQFDVDLAMFLLVRGDYAWLGYGWDGCHDKWPYQWIDKLDKDYGIPVTDNYTQIESGVFQRKYTKANVIMDCNSYTSNITLF